jgi:hypothetical protein
MDAFRLFPVTCPRVISTAPPRFPTTSGSTLLTDYPLGLSLWEMVGWIWKVKQRSITFNVTWTPSPGTPVNVSGSAIIPKDRIEPEAERSRVCLVGAQYVNKLVYDVFPKSVRVQLFAVTTSGAILSDLLFYTVDGKYYPRFTVDLQGTTSNIFRITTAPFLLTTPNPAGIDCSIQMTDGSTQILPFYRAAAFDVDQPAISGSVSISLDSVYTS